MNIRLYNRQGIPILDLEVTAKEKRLITNAVRLLLENPKRTATIYANGKTYVIRGTEISPIIRIR